MSGWLIRLLDAAFRRGFRFRQPSPGAERRPVMIESRRPVRLQIGDSSQVDMRPSHHVRLAGDFERLLKITAGPCHVTVHGRNLRQDEQGPPRILVLLIERLLRQLLRALDVPGREPLRCGQQEFPLRTRQMQHLGVGVLGKVDLGHALLFPPEVDVGEHALVGVAQTHGTFSNFTSA